MTDKQEIPNWIYTGDEYGTGERAMQPRNFRGVSGRCSVKPGEIHVNGKTTRTDMTLDIDGIVFQVPRALAEELNAALCTALRPYAGLSLFERVMEQLDLTIDRLMTGGEAADGRDPGRAESLCWVLAMIRNSYQPDAETEKQLAMTRYENRQEGN